MRPSARALVKYRLVEPSESESVSDAAILASALASARALVKYRLVEPSDKSSVSAAAILASARALVKYRLEPSARSLVVLLERLRFAPVAAATFRSALASARASV